MTSLSAPLPTARNYLNVASTVRSWLLTVDHKRIAILYLVCVTVMFLLGSIGAAIIRLDLLTPKGDVVSDDAYNRMFTMHGTVMVFFFMLPAIPAVLGNFLIPLMVGARDLAFPKLNLASWYLFMTGAVFSILSLILGGVDTGWTFYAPYSSLYANSAVLSLAVGIFIAGFSSILTGLNFIVTTHTMRAPGMTWFRLPLFVWSMYATSLIMVLATPVLAIVIVLLGLERVAGVGIFDPAIGGDPILFQHLFWFYSHPAVYIMILPAMAVVSEIVACFAHKRIFGYHAVAFSSLAIALLGFLVWGHHMFVSGQSIYAGLVFSILSFLVAVPSAIKVFNWTATLYKAQVRFDTPFLYVIGFIGLFVIGGVTGLFLAALAVDVHVHDTYFVVAHFHYIMVGGAVMAYLGGIHYWWPKMTGRMYSEGWAKFSAVLIFVGFNLTFFPQFILGYGGMPRRYHHYASEFQVLNVLSTAGATILGIGYVFPLTYLLYSLRPKGRRAEANPWDARGLEWIVPSPPPTENFVQTPQVTWEAYAYDQPPPPLLAPHDAAPQTQVDRP